MHKKKSFVRTTKISCTDLARKTKSNMLMFGKPLVILAALPKERYINFVDANHRSVSHLFGDGHRPHPTPCGRSTALWTVPVHTPEPCGRSPSTARGPTPHTPRPCDPLDGQTSNLKHVNSTAPLSAF